jgi:putative transposase
MDFLPARYPSVPVFGQDMLGKQLQLLQAADLGDAADELAFTSFPPSHWKKIWFTNPLERLS